jgi:hypothetical protein
VNYLWYTWVRVAFPIPILSSVYRIGIEREGNDL